MSNKRYVLACLRTSLIAAALVSAFWGFHALFAPVPKVVDLYLSSDLILSIHLSRWWDVPAIFVGVNVLGWAIEVTRRTHWGISYRLIAIGVMCGLWSLWALKTPDPDGISLSLIGVALCFLAAALLMVLSGLMVGLEYADKRFFHSYATLEKRRLARHTALVFGSSFGLIFGVAMGFVPGSIVLVAMAAVLMFLYYFGFLGAILSHRNFWKRGKGQ